MSKPSDFFGAAPKTVLNKPLMHVQDQKATGTSGGNVVADTWTQRDLNVILQNEIPGTSLTSNQITLPAGTYFIEAESCFYSAAVGASERIIAIVDGSGNKLLRSVNVGSASGTISSVHSRLSGQITLTQSTTIELQYYAGAAQTGGLGTPLTTFATGVTEVYSDLKVWQLDSLIKTPVLVNDSLYPLPGSTYVTGNILGLEYAKTDDNEVTVQAGICMDSTNTVLLSASSSQAVTIGSTINEIYNLFLCDDGVVRTDTDVDGANLSAYDFRWIGFVLNDSSGVLYDFVQYGDHLRFSDNSTRVVISASVGATSTRYDFSAFIPESRVISTEVGLHYANSGWGGLYQDNSGAIGLQVGNIYVNANFYLISAEFYGSHFWAYNGSGSASTFVIGCKLRR